MSVIHQIIEDVITVATYPEDARPAYLERQLAHCIAVVVMKRTAYRHAVAKVNVYDTGTITVKVDLFDFTDGPVVAYVEYSNATQQPIKSRKL